MSESAAQETARAIRYIVPFEAGPTSAQAQWLAQRLGAWLAQPVVVENHPGASGMAGTERVARAAPDGHTLLAANPGPLTVGPNLCAAGYDPVSDFAPVVLMATVTSVIAVRPDLPVATLGDLVALARMREGAVTYGSPGTGTVGHLAMALFRHLAGVRMTHRPCEGLAEAIPALESGQVDVLVIPLPEARPLALQGRIRALAGTRRSRSALWPELPTVDEAGVAGFESFNWNGVAAPRGTPREIVERINRGINSVLRSDEGRAYFAGKGYEVEGGTPEAFGAFIRAEKEKWARVIAGAGLRRTPGPERR